MKSIEGMGKSLFIDFFIEYVMGSESRAKGHKGLSVLCAHRIPWISHGQKVFESIRGATCDQQDEWNVCDGKLKNMVTGTEMNYSDK